MCLYFMPCLEGACEWWELSYCRLIDPWEFLAAYGKTVYRSIGTEEGIDKFIVNYTIVQKFSRNSLQVHRDPDQDKALNKDE